MCAGGLWPGWVGPADGEQVVGGVGLADVGGVGLGDSGLPGGAVGLAGGALLAGMVAFAGGERSP
ncbi:MAG TPA: hypothetical protein VF951_01750 [Streptosporangiaceae bacterium]